MLKILKAEGVTSDRRETRVIHGNSDGETIRIGKKYHRANNRRRVTRHPRPVAHGYCPHHVLHMHPSGLIGSGYPS